MERRCFGMEPGPSVGVDDKLMVGKRGSIAERRSGFNNAPEMLSMDGSFQYLTIPPGLSPAALLDSPIMPPDSQSLVQIKTVEDQVFFLKQVRDYNSDVHVDIDDSDDTTAEGKCVTEQRDLFGDQVNHRAEQLNGEDTASNQLLEGDRMTESATGGLCRLSEDGYNWRKYGQKQVKGSEFPRSYYKCTQSSCQVKKKVERSLDGQITEIIYKGSHNHPKPQLPRLSVFGSPYSINEASDSILFPGSYANADGSSLGNGPNNNSISDRKADGLERTSSAVTDISELLSTVQGRHSNSATDNWGLSSNLASQDDVEDVDTEGSMFLEDGGDDESESKRRKKQSCLIETNPASRAVREPKVVVQTVSEADILDDGYRWRKYGQKVVKGNPNPRSYYKCTNPGCSVRKHVERASHDFKSVITAYEGRHNHEVPVARNNNHISSSGNSYSAPITLPGSINMSRNDVQGQDLVPQFDKQLEIQSNYLRCGYAENFTGDDLKFHLQTMPYGTLGLNSSHLEAHQAIHGANIIHDFPISLPTGFQCANLALAGYPRENGRLLTPDMQSFPRKQALENGMMLARLPKQEQESPVCIKTVSSSHTSLYK